MSQFQLCFFLKPEEFNRDPNEFGFVMRKGMSPYPYQKDTVKQMLFLEDKDNEKWGLRGGILVADMGLGKTIITQTLVKADKVQIRERDRKMNTHTNIFPTLVIINKGLIPTWRDDKIKFFGSSDKHLKMLIMFRNRMKHTAIKYDHITIDQLRKYDIVVTTYDALIQQASVSSKNKNNSNKKTGPALFFRIPWHRIVMDESQRAGNCKTSTFKTLMMLTSHRKWNLT